MKYIQNNLENNTNCYFVGFELERHRLRPNVNVSNILTMPICEETILGISIGLSRNKQNVFVDLMGLPFVYRTFDMLNNQLALSERSTSYDDFGNIIVRVVCDDPLCAGIQHSNSAYPLLLKISFIRIFVPINPEDIYLLDEIRTKFKNIVVVFYDNLRLSNVIKNFKLVRDFFYIKESKSKIFILTLPHLVQNLTDGFSDLEASICVPILYDRKVIHRFITEKKEFKFIVLDEYGHNSHLSSFFSINECNKKAIHFYYQLGKIMTNREKKDFLNLIYAERNE